MIFMVSDGVCGFSSALLPSSGGGMKERDIISVGSDQCFCLRTVSENSPFPGPLKWAENLTAQFARMVFVVSIGWKAERVGMPSLFQHSPTFSDLGWGATMTTGDQRLRSFVVRPQQKGYMTQTLHGRYGGVM